MKRLRRVAWLVMVIADAGLLACLRRPPGQVVKSEPAPT